jgi:catechol-2,3-dioxygenase
MIMRPSEQAKAGGFFRPRRLGHANLFVSDYERASQFYQSVVGFEEVYRQPDNRASFLSNGNTYHDLGLTDVHTPGGGATPNPAKEASLTLRLDQPLLRNFGSDVTLAQARLNRNAQPDPAR